MRNFVFITGASRGLGKFLAEAFWMHGYDLILVARDLKLLHENIKLLDQKENKKIYCFQCDLGDLAQVERLIIQLTTFMPEIQVLINNAATQGPIGPLIKNQFTEWEKAYRTNFFSPVLLSKAVLPFMMKADHGSIINLSGGGATGPRENFTSYASAKASLVRFSETLAQELRHSKIKINCIAPGAMKTDLLLEVLHTGSDLSGKNEYEAAYKVFSGEGSAMEQVANLALFLASRRSDGITGKLISAVWDDWENWPKHLDLVSNSDLYTLRRIVGKDRGYSWGDK